MGEFLTQRFAAVSPDEWRRRLDAAEVVDEAGLSVSAQTPYRPYGKLYYYRSLATEPRIPFEARVLFHDEHLLVVDKPHFLPVTPTGRYVQETLLVRLRQELGLDDLAPLHRIDRETAGLVMFSLRPQERNAYHALFREHRVVKAYEAIAPWREDLSLPLTRRSRMAEGSHFMTMTEIEGEPNAETRIELLDMRGQLARYRLLPWSGQRHQLRVHMNALGLPILGDRIYPQLQPQPDLGAESYEQPLQLLSRRLSFIDPLSGHLRDFESQLALNW